MFSCRGTTTENPPVHLLHNMDDGGRLDSQSQNLASYELEEEPYEDLNGDGNWSSEEPYEDLNENGYWDSSYTVYINEYKQSMNNLVEGTFARENDQSLLSNEEINQITTQTTGVKDGGFIKKIPSKYIEEGFLDRGQERYNIYCSVCHGVTGDGAGMVMNKNYSWNKNVKPANLQDLSDKDNSCNDGYLFNVISNGKGQMSGYPQISVSDRWAIVAYVRALSAANGVNIQCCNKDDLRDIKNSLKNMPSLEDQLLSDEFECLIELGQVQKIMKNDMVEIQQITNCDAYDGQWGGGTLKKWKKWKREISK